MCTWKRYTERKNAEKCKSIILSHINHAETKNTILYIISISYNNLSKEEAWLTFHLCLREQICYSFRAPSQMIDETLSICLYNFKLKDCLHHFGIIV